MKPTYLKQKKMWKYYGGEKKKKKEKSVCMVSCHLSFLKKNINHNG